MLALMDTERARVEVQSDFVGLPTREGFPDALFDPGRTIIGQERCSVSVVLGFEYSRNRDGVPLCVSDDVCGRVNVVWSLSIRVEWRDQPGIVCGGFRLF